MARYAHLLNCAKINSSFHRSHRHEVYARWAAQTPSGFRFAVKIPRTISHDRRLRGTRTLLARFIAEVSGLGDRLGVLLVQLPPSLPFEARPVRTFFEWLASEFGGAVVCEPRHATWFKPSADRLLVKLRVGRVAADPVRWPGGAIPGGWMGPAGDGVGAVIYHRWHGSPRAYHSAYGDDWLHERASELKRWPASADCWLSSTTPHLARQCRMRCDCVRVFDGASQGGATGWQNDTVCVCAPRVSARQSAAANAGTV